MGENSFPLLSTYAEPGYLNKTIFFVLLAKWDLKFVMWFVLISWIALRFLYPAESACHLFKKCIQFTDGTVFGTTGSIFQLFSGPVLLIAVLSAAYLIISGEEQEFYSTLKNPSFQWWTFPVLVDGPFGVVSAAEMTGILLFVFLWYMDYLCLYHANHQQCVSEQFTFKLKRKSVN